jgi:putative hydrolase
MLREGAELLDQQRANPFRARAYRAAADTVAGLEEDVGAIVAREGLDGLLALPGVGSGIAAAIHEILTTGHWAQLERLRGTLDPEALFRSIPGVGPALARRIHETLQVDTLEALELAAHDGRLAGVPGIGPRRAALVRATLAGSTGGRRRPVASPASRLTASIRAVRRGCPCFIPSGEAGTSRRSTRTPRALMSWDGPATGSC